MERRIVTPLCKDGSVPTIVSRYDGRCFWGGLIDTGHYPAAGVLEIWKED